MASASLPSTREDKREEEYQKQRDEVQALFAKACWESPGHVQGGWVVGMVVGWLGGGWWVVVGLLGGGSGVVR